jgi:membrane protein YdbS with pleckstrin-like domain
MAIAMSKTREKYPLSTKKVLKKTLAGTLGLAIFLFIAYGILTTIVTSAKTFGNLLGGATFGIFGFLFLIVVLTYMYQKWYYDVYFYDLTDDYVIIKKGPITPHEITIPYERIQDVYVDQDILDRIFGLYDVHLSSATISSGMAAHIDGVEKPASDGLRGVLLEAVSRKISRNRNQSTPPTNTESSV